MLTALASISLLLVAVGQPGNCQLDSSQRQLLLDLHNQARSSASPRAANMEEMEWNSELAQVAQNYAQRCVFEHNSRRASDAPSFRSVGENLAISSGLGDNYEGLFILWHNERNDYNFNSNACSGVCGHYTQVVWATSNQLGCGAYRCDTVAGFSGRNALLLVCNYGPAGNFVGRSPYIAGASCTSCPTDKRSCMNSLCRNGTTSGTGTGNTDGTGNGTTGNADGAGTKPDQSFLLVILFALMAIKALY